MLPKRADPVAGALIGTLVLVALLAPPVLVVWLAMRARRRFSSQLKADEDPEFGIRFQELEKSILEAKTEDSR